MLKLIVKGWKGRTIPRVACDPVESCNSSLEPCLELLEFVDAFNEVVRCKSVPATSSADIDVEPAIHPRDNVLSAYHSEAEQQRGLDDRLAPPKSISNGSRYAPILRH